MSALFRRNSNLRCFFCNAAQTISINPRNFRCHSCACWNRYDDSGEIISDDPAMHDESLNSHSFARRGSPSKDRIPTPYGKGPFCHSCQTNQMLLINLLSSYLPPPDNPDYHRRLARLPEYRESLHQRYPPVCESCLPAVEEEIRKKDHMARTNALGGWLKKSRGKDQQRRVSGPSKSRDHFTFEMIAWHFRGLLWGISLLTTVLGYATVALQFQTPRTLITMQPILPLLVILSLLWTVWDPTYSSYKNAQLQGRDVRVSGKRSYIILQMTVWVLRLLTSTLLVLRHYEMLADALQLYIPYTQFYFIVVLFVEILVFISSLFVLRLQHPPAIRLIDSRTSISAISRSTTPMVGTITRSTTPAGSLVTQEPDLSSLTLSSKPVMKSVNPVFGHPSLLSTSVPHDGDTDEMDWVPTDPVALSAFQKGKQRATSDDESWIRPQKFFAPEQPTGLEGLFEKTRLVDDTPDSVSSNQLSQVQTRLQLHLHSWWRIYFISFIPALLGVVFRWWFTRQRIIVESQ
ncbi:hypothetical protein AMATHDRAFT_134874 [Amanita thiersii Skay4041]|uniref:Ima1 N-terminal domain-containing protein n=1 Tax=Amanita thiersii Skay4041 TaxID=703135 RepID=A0A2A9NYU8_9AGAR|nr:hypothetical protein AMATHDRAFT_134874 [Amanita thiersii Skay4041]